LEATLNLLDDGMKEPASRRGIKEAQEKQDASGCTAHVSSAEDKPQAGAQHICLSNEEAVFIFRASHARNVNTVGLELSMILAARFNLTSSQAVHDIWYMY
jgi:hypothetical protein